MIRDPTTQEKHPEFLQDQRAFFDELISREWHTYHNPDWDISRQYEVAQLSRHVRQTTVLDVGCGCQDMLIAVHPETHQANAFDYSTKSIETADWECPHARVRRQVIDINAVGEDIPQVDLLVGSNVIEYTTDPIHFFERYTKKNRSGGYLAVFTPYWLRFANYLRRWQGRLARLSDSQHFREYTLEELSTLRCYLGLQSIASFGHGMDLPLIGARFPLGWSLALGRRWPECTDGICFIFWVVGRTKDKG